MIKSSRAVIQRIVTSPECPTDADFITWVQAACPKLSQEVTLRLVDTPEMTVLNQTYRHKQGPTNVLSFPYDPIPGAGDAVLGDIVLCVPVIAREAVEQQVSLQAHWAHMTVHGMLHLQGYDHQEEAEAVEMQALETRLLTQLGFSDPYAIERK